MESAESLITSMFFDPRRYDLAKVGRYKFNKKLLLRNRIAGQMLAEEVVDVTTGEIIAKPVLLYQRNWLTRFRTLLFHMYGFRARSVTQGAFQHGSGYQKPCGLNEEELKELGVTELVYYPVLAKILEENEKLEDIKDAIKREIHELNSKAHYKGRYSGIY